MKVLNNTINNGIGKSGYPNHFLIQNNSTTNDMNQIANGSCSVHPCACRGGLQSDQKYLVAVSAVYNTTSFGK